MAGNRKAFLLAATHSGAGKTTVSLGLLAALVRRGYQVQPFKCGPDFIDPSLHRMVTGKISRNLDLRMCGEKFVTTCFQYHADQAEIAVVEGVMGLFDGGAGSGAALAKTLGLPVILIVDAKACAESIAAVVKGFESLDPELPIAGVIFNRVGSPKHLALLEQAVTSHCRSPIIGALPRNEAFRIPERHLGLHMGDEGPLTGAQLDLLADSITANLKLDLLLAISSRAPAASGPALHQPRGPETSRPAVRIAVAQDQAFCFYYQDNLDLLSSLGAEIVPFSPLADQALPPDIAGIYLGGGYPELHAAALAANKPMLAAIHNWSTRNRPLYAECGGFIYLSQGLTDHHHAFWPLAGIFPCRARMKERLSQLGYRQALITGPCLFGSTGALHGHEFHYSELEAIPARVKKRYRLQDGRTEGFQLNNTLGSYLHLHFGRTPEAARNFVTLCRESH